MSASLIGKKFCSLEQGQARDKVWSKEQKQQGGKEWGDKASERQPTPLSLIFVLFVYQSPTLYKRVNCRGG